MITVLNLSTWDEVDYSGITPREAVIAAYAQSLGDYNTWDYEKKYGHLVRVGSRRITISCGDWCCLLKNFFFEREWNDPCATQPTDS